MRAKLFHTIRFAALTLLGLTFQITAQNDPATDWTTPFQKCWDFETVEITAFPSLSGDGQTIFLTLDEGFLQAVDTSSSKIIWRSQFGGAIISKPFSEDNKIYLVNKTLNQSEEVFTLRAVSAATGLTLWHKNLILRNNPAKIFIFSNSAALFLISDAGQILSLARTDGAEKWRRDLQSEVTGEPLLDENKIFVGTADNKISVLSANGGENIFRLEILNSPTGNLLHTSELIVTGDSAGRVSAFRAADRKLLWRARTGAQIAGISQANGDFLVSSNDGFVYLLEAKSGDRIWKKRLAGRIIGKPLVLNNFALLQTVDGENAPVLDVAGGKLVNQILYNTGSIPLNSALYINKKVVFSTSRGLSAFSVECDAK